MKIKKIVLMFSMIAVLFSLTACSSGQEEVNFSYTDTDIIGSSISLSYSLLNADDATKAYLNAEGEEVYQKAIFNVEAAEEECGGFTGYLSREDGSSIMIDLQNLDSSNEDDAAKLSQFLGTVDATVKEDGANVLVTLKTVYEDRVVDYCFVYEEDPAYAYGGSSIAYKPTEITVVPEYTMGEKMAKAGMNTLVGMAAVFIILIFISFIIAQLEKVNKLFSGKKKEEAVEEQAAVPMVKATPVIEEQADLMQDEELVAVITAAIMAANADSISENSIDKLVVRSIKKAKR